MAVVFQLPTSFNAHYFLLSLSLTLLLLPQSEAGRLSKIILPAVTPFEAASLDLPTCCPESPSLYCDFFFQNYAHTVPEFHIKDGISDDHAISPIDLAALNWKGSFEQFSPEIYDSKTGNPVLVSSSWMNGTLLQCPEPLSPFINAGNQFYVTGDKGTGIAKLHMRNFQRATRHQHGRKFYYGRCVLLPLTRISVTGTDVELDHEDGNTEYPEKRRCVVFRTRP